MQVGVIALMVGTLWLDLAVDAANARSFFAVAFVSIMFLAMGQIPQQNLVQSSKPVFFKHRDNFFYGGGALPQCLAVLSLHCLKLFCLCSRHASVNCERM